MAYLLDAAVILIFGAAVLIGYKRGFIRSMVSLVGFALALVLAFSLSGVLAGGVYNGLLQSPTEKAIESVITNAVGTTVPLQSSVEQAMDALPGVVKKFLESKGMTADSITQNIDSGVGDTVHTLAVSMTESIVRPVMTLLIRWIAFFLLFLVFFIAAAFLGRLVTRVLHFTPLGNLNGILGAVLGAVKGVLWVLLAVTVLQLIAGFTADTALISRKTLEDSFVVGFVENHNPLYSKNNDLLAQFNALVQP